MTQSPRRHAVVALVFLVPVPSFGVWFATAVAPGDLGSGVFAFSKVWLLAFPLLWHMRLDGQRPNFPRPQRAGMTAAVVTGLGIFGVILAAYAWVGRDWIDIEQFREKAIAMGFESRSVYLLLALYWCTVNSLVEEYVWRWFVFSRCERLLPRVPAVVLSGLLFTLHHIVALAFYFDWRVTVLGSLGVWIGGAIWSWIYLTSRNIWAPYVSHVFADVAIFGIGYTVLY